MECKEFVSWSDREIGHLLVTELQMLTPYSAWLEDFVGDTLVTTHKVTC